MCIEGQSTNLEEDRNVRGEILKAQVHLERGVIDEVGEERYYPSPEENSALKEIREQATYLKIIKHYCSQQSQ